MPSLNDQNGGGVAASGFSTKADIFQGDTEAAYTERETCNTLLACLTGLSVLNLGLILSSANVLIVTRGGTGTRAIFRRFRHQMGVKMSSGNRATQHNLTSHHHQHGIYQPAFLWMYLHIETVWRASVFEKHIFFLRVRIIFEQQLFNPIAGGPSGMR